MDDPVELLEHLEGPPPPPHAPPWPRQKRPLWIPAVAGLAALALGLILAWPRDTTRLRGSEDAPAVDLRVLVVADGQAERIHRGGTYRPGQQVIFRVAAARDAEVHLWVDGPGGVHSLGVERVGPEPEDVADARGLVAYRLDRPGTYTFFASSTDEGVCDDVACASLSVEVR